jgi:hypothetical protein
MKKLGHSQEGKLHINTKDGSLVSKTKKVVTCFRDQGDNREHKVKLEDIDNAVGGEEEENSKL